MSEFRSVEGLEDVYVAEKGGLRCCAIRLKNGSLCLFSPVKGPEGTAQDSLARLGPVEFLLAPNHYHNKGIAEYAAAFPNALLCGPPAAVPRLEKQTGLRFKPLDQLKGQLPGTVQIVKTEGLKTGEIWLRVTSGHHTAWLVVDAFCGPKGDMTRFSDTPSMLGTFPNFGIGDKATYKEWVERQIEADRPTMLIPCHGRMVSAKHLPETLHALIGERVRA